VLFRGIRRTDQSPVCLINGRERLLATPSDQAWLPS
jgi:hypothetical protein